jgi:hypothetical protein
VTSSAGPFGPWSPTCDRIERGKQLRTLASIAYLRLGPRHPLVAELRAAEHDPMALVRAQDLVDALPPLPRRRLIATFSAITWPAQPKKPGGGAP